MKIIWGTPKHTLLQRLKEQYPTHEVNYNYWVISNTIHNIVITVWNPDSKKLTKLISNQSDVSEDEGIKYLLEQLNGI